MHLAVVGRVIDAAKANGRSHLIAFAGVIIDHIQDHFEACRMEVFHHLLKLAHLFARRGVALGVG